MEGLVQCKMRQELILAYKSCAIFNKQWCSTRGMATYSVVTPKKLELCQIYCQQNSFKSLGIFTPTTRFFKYICIHLIYDAKQGGCWQVLIRIHIILLFNVNDHFFWQKWMDSSYVMVMLAKYIWKRIPKKRFHLVQNPNLNHLNICDI